MYWPKTEEYHHPIHGVQKWFGISSLATAANFVEEFLVPAYGVQPQNPFIMSKRTLIITTIKRLLDFLPSIHPSEQYFVGNSNTCERIIQEKKPKLSYTLILYFSFVSSLSLIRGCNLAFCCEKYLSKTPLLCYFHNGEDTSFGIFF